MEKLNSLISKINSLNLNEAQYTEIYKILKKENIKIMKNNNGAFVNLNNIEPKVIKELEGLINYINNQEI